MRLMCHLSGLIVLLWMMANTVIAGEQALSVVCDEWPPYQVVEKNGTVSGFSTAIVLKVFHRMNVTVEHLGAYPWKRAMVMLKDGSVDALFSANYSEERTAFAHYPNEAIVESPWLIWSRAKDNIIYTGLADLKGKRVGVVRGYSYSPEFWDILKKEAEYEEVSNDESNFLKLNRGRIDILAAERGNGYAILRNLKLTGIIPHTRHPIKTDGLYIIFNKSRISESFVRQFSDTLRQVKNDPMYHRLHDAFFNQRPDNN